jgi:hypothetical protein
MDWEPTHQYLVPSFRGKRAKYWNEKLYNICYDPQGTLRPGWHEEQHGVKHVNGDFKKYRHIFGLSRWEARRLLRKA